MEMPRTSTGAPFESMSMIQRGLLETLRGPSPGRSQAAPGRNGFERSKVVSPVKASDGPQTIEVVSDKTSSRKRRPRFH
jgi:hypothetical protein